jgi:butyrate kinase
MHSRSEEILVVNPGSTSTKAAVFDGPALRASITIRHAAEELAAFPGINDQFAYRLAAVRTWATGQAAAPSAVVTLGGLLRPVSGGTYRVNAAMLNDARSGIQGEHASNLGCALADDLARGFHCQALVVDPVSVDEFEPLARYSGHPLLPRRSLSHALNIHAVARRAGERLDIAYTDLRLVVAHLGGGISVAPVRGGRIIDVNDASSGGPFSPERTGTLPLREFITLCFSGVAEEQVRALVVGKGGLVAYLGTNDAADVERRIAAGDDAAREVYEAMAYQIAKEIGAMAAVLQGSLHAVVLTGGLASSTMLVNWIAGRVAFLGPLLVFPGEDELRSLAEAALRVLREEETALEYP